MDVKNPLPKQFQACPPGVLQPGQASGDLLKNQMQWVWGGTQISEFLKGPKGDSVHRQGLETTVVVNEFAN